MYSLCSVLGFQFTLIVLGQIQIEAEEVRSLPISNLTLAECWLYIGTHVGPTSVSDVGPTSSCSSDQRRADVGRRPYVGPTSGQCQLPAVPQCNVSGSLNAQPMLDRRQADIEPTSGQRRADVRPTSSSKSIPLLCITVLDVEGCLQCSLLCVSVFCHQMAKISTIIGHLE